MKNQTKNDRTGYLYKRGKDGEHLPAGDKRWGIYYLQYDIAGKRYRKCRHNHMVFHPDFGTSHSTKNMRHYLGMTIMALQDKSYF